MKIISRIFYGFIIGVILKKMKPSLENTPITVSLIVGILGCLLGGFIADLIFDQLGNHHIYDLYKFIIMINTSVVCIYAYNIIITYYSED